MYQSTNIPCYQLPRYSLQPSNHFTQNHALTDAQALKNHGHRPASFSLQYAVQTLIKHTQAVD